MSSYVDENRKNLKNKKVLVVGMGRSGMAAVRELYELGSDVSIQDINTLDKLNVGFANFVRNENIKSYLGTEPEDMSQFDMLVLSPGVAPDLPFIQAARDAGAEVIGELELAYRLTRGRYVAITGTNGKTTTTTLTGEIFEHADLKSTVVGNIGIAAISKADDSSEDEWIISECSSFQLESTDQFHPKISAILNLTPDHLNRHKTMEAYGAAKAKVFANQDENDYLIINYDNKECWALAENCHAHIIPFSREERLDEGAYLIGDMMVIKDEHGEEHPICRTEEMKIFGDHNIENALAAAAISFAAGIDTDVIADVLRSFPGVEHRIEYSGIVDGVKYYNDSKGTNVDAAIIALKALKNNIILIAGGDGKAQDFTELAENLKGRVKAMVLLGRDADKIAECADKVGFTNYVFEKDMNECVKKAAELAQPGDKVLLSPACASWDMYDNYEQRGDHFKECVEMLNK